MQVQNQKLLSIGSPHWYFVAILHVSDLDIDQQFIYITFINGLYFDHFSSAYKYPVYAVQWHPEKNNFVWTSKAHINHDASAVRVSQYFADFFVAQGK